MIIRHFPVGYTVDHVQLFGWGGIKNGALLKLASDNGYDALISADKNMSYQQNEDALNISVVVLNVYQLRLNDLVALLPSALQELQQATRPRFIRIDV